MADGWSVRGVGGFILVLFGFIDLLVVGSWQIFGGKENYEKPMPAKTSELGTNLERGAR